MLPSVLSKLVNALIYVEPTSTYRVPCDVHCSVLDTIASFRFGIVAVLFAAVQTGRTRKLPTYVFEAFDQAFVRC
jgi:hypothetical protein